MKITLILITVLIAVIFYYGYPIKHAFSISKKIEKTAIPYEQHPSNPSITVLIAGDSTGVGTGAGDNKYSTAGRLGSEYPKADITNMSENGLKLTGLQEKLAALPAGKKYNLMLIQIGANDIVGLTSLATIKNDLANVLDLATEHADKVIILTAGNVGLAPVFKVPLSNFLTSRTLSVRSIYKHEVSMHPNVRYVDLFKDKEHDAFVNDVEKYYAIDRFHPSALGYAAWYTEIKKVLDSK